MSQKRSPNRGMSSLDDKSASFPLEIVQCLSRFVDSCWAHREQSPMLQEKAPKSNADTIMHSKIALKPHYITDTVTLPVNETAAYCLKWPLLSVRCDRAMSVKSLISRRIWAFRLALDSLTSTVTNTPVSMNFPNKKECYLFPKHWLTRRSELYNRPLPAVGLSGIWHKGSISLHLWASPMPRAR